MNKTELASSVATRASVTKATADSAVAAVGTRRKGLDRGLRDLCHPEPTGALGPQPRYRRDHRHRRRDRTVVQGRQDVPRCAQSEAGLNTRSPTGHPTRQGDRANRIVPSHYPSPSPRTRSDAPQMNRHRFRSACAMCLTIRQVRGDARTPLTWKHSNHTLRSDCVAGVRDERGSNDRRRPQHDAHRYRAVVCPGLVSPRNKQGVIRDLRHRETSVVHRKRRISPAATIGGPVSGSPPLRACLRPSLSSRAFRSTTVVTATSTDGSSAS